MPERRIVIDHITLGVSDLERSREFYRRALAPLGYGEIGQPAPGERAVGFGPDDLDDFYISLDYPVGGPLHIAFAADDREQVDAFYAAAIAAGATDNGPPGIREVYSPRYYGAFVLDPDGNNIEAVFHAPE